MRLSISVWHRFCLSPASRGREVEFVFFISKSTSLSDLPRSVDKTVSLVSAPLGLADRVRELMIRPLFSDRSHWQDQTI